MSMMKKIRLETVNTSFARKGQVIKSYELLERKEEVFAVKSIVNGVPECHLILGIASVVINDNVINIEATVITKVPYSTFALHSELGACSLSPNGMETVLQMRCG